MVEYELPSAWQLFMAMTALQQGCVLDLENRAETLRLLVRTYADYMSEVKQIPGELRADAAAAVRAAFDTALAEPGERFRAEDGRLILIDC